MRGLLNFHLNSIGGVNIAAPIQFLPSPVSEGRQCGTKRSLPAKVSISGFPEI